MSLTLLAILAPSSAAERHLDLLAAGSGSPESRAKLALPELTDLEPSGVLPSALGNTVRFSQRHRGVPVLGADAAVVVRADGSVPAARLGFSRTLTVDVTPDISQEEAHVVAGVSHLPMVSGELAVLPEGTGRLVWSLHALTQNGPEQILIDAHSGQLITRQSTDRHAQGRVYELDPVSTPTTSDVDLIDLYEDSSQYGLYTGWLQVVNYSSGTLSAGDLHANGVGSNSDDDFLYDPPESTTDGTDSFAAVNVYHHLSQAIDGFKGITGLDTRWALLAITNYQEDGVYDNASYTRNYWTNSSSSNEWLYTWTDILLFGQGSSVDFGVDASIVVHEAGHWLTKNAIDFNQGQLYITSTGYSPWAAAIDEGISDYFAASYLDNPVIGGYALDSFGATRDISEAPQSCPGDVTGLIHEDGRFIGRVGWALREAYGAESADAMVWGALTLMTADSTFSDFASGLRLTGDAMLSEGTIDSTDALDEVLTAHGLDDCGTVQPIDDSAVTVQVWGIDDLIEGTTYTCQEIAQYYHTHSMFQFTLETDADTASLRFEAEAAPKYDGDLKWQLYLRRGQPVEFTTHHYPIVSTSDVASEAFTGTTGSFAIPINEPTPGETWYGVVISSNCPNTTFTITGEASTEPVDTTEPDDTGDTEPDNGDTGDTSDTGDTGDVVADDPTPEPDGGEKNKSGCSHVSASSAAWLPLLLAGALGLRRRRDTLSA